MERKIAASAQLALHLESRMDADSGLKRAWARSRLRVPYHVAMQNRALAICLRNVAAADERRRSRGTQGWLFDYLPPWKRYPKN